MWLIKGGGGRSPYKSINGNCLIAIDRIHSRQPECQGRAICIGYCMLQSCYAGRETRGPGDLCLFKTKCKFLSNGFLARAVCPTEEVLASKATVPMMPPSKKGLIIFSLHHRMPCTEMSFLGITYWVRQHLSWAVSEPKVNGLRSPVLLPSALHSVNTPQCLLLAPPTALGTWLASFLLHYILHQAMHLQSMHLRLVMHLQSNHQCLPVR